MITNVTARTITFNIPGNTPFHLGRYGLVDQRAALEAMRADDEAYAAHTEQVPAC